ncbi:Uncharacterised protein [Xylophilus ampelinus]|nr:Uncharacterised protein [Xylophilus ampelinus]
MMRDLEDKEMKGAPTLLTGLLVAAVLFGFGYSAQRRNQQRVEAAMASCVASTVGQHTREGLNKSTDHALVR